MTLTLADLDFHRPDALQAGAPPELRGRAGARDEVRLMVSSPAGHRHGRFRDLTEVLDPGDLLVVNRSATLPASLEALGPHGPFTLNLSTRYGPALWLAEPRRSPSEPGPLPLEPGDRAEVAGVALRFVAPYPGLPRLWFVHAEGDLDTVMRRRGAPIRYGYAAGAFDLDAYQTVFADTPGSAEMPSAARPFSARVLDALDARGVAVARLTLHTGVSSLEIDDVQQGATAALGALPLYPEPFEVPPATAERIEATRAAGGRVIAVGTTVVRALESVWDGRRIGAGRGFTRRVVRPESCGCMLDGLLTGLHDPKATHLAMLYALAGRELVLDAYREAVAEGYLWHEFGDSHLILPKG